MQWCMIPIEATGVLKQWRESIPSPRQGVTQDNSNVLITTVPPQNVLSQVRSVELTQPQDVLDLVAVIGRELSVGDNVIVYGDADLFITAHSTPHWRLWCAPYLWVSDDDAEYIKNLSLLGLPSMPRKQARSTIRSIVNGA